jgi:hypothetical protein
VGLGLVEFGAAVASSEPLVGVEQLGIPTVLVRETGRIRKFQSGETDKVGSEPILESSRVARHSVPASSGDQKLHRLARSKKVVRLLRKFGLFVESLIELPPRDGHPPELMGFNVGRGIEIHVRLLDQFHLTPLTENEVLSILCHELAHNRHSDHGADFRRFEQQLRKTIGLESLDVLGGCESGSPGRVLGHCWFPIFN